MRKTKLEELASEMPIEYTLRNMSLSISTSSERDASHWTREIVSPSFTEDFPPRSSVQLAASKVLRLTPFTFTTPIFES